MKIKQIISIFIITLMLTATLPITALAQSSVGSTSLETNIGEDVIQGQHTQYDEVEVNETQTQVYLTVEDSDLIVSLPTTVILSGIPDEQGKYIGKYSVGVAGDMSGDKIVNIEPESPTVEIKQKGKDNKTATVEQVQTSFTTDDFKNNTKTTGTVTGDKLTAGSWNGSFNFEITTVKVNRYYSSINLAAQDINQETVNTDKTVADLETAENAVCGVYKLDDTYRIEVYKDVENQSNVVFEKNTKINLNRHTLTFNKQEGIKYGASLSVVNGTINNIASNPLISADKSNINGIFLINNITINQSVPTTISSSVTAIKTYNQVVRIVNTNINQIGDGNSDYNIMGVSVLNNTTASDVNIKNSNYNAEITNAKNIMAIQKGSNLYCDELDIKINTKTARVYGIYSVENNDDISNSNIEVTTKSSVGAGLFYTKSNKATIDNVIINNVSDSGNMYGIASNNTHNEINIKKSDIKITTLTGSAAAINVDSKVTTVNACNIYSTSEKVANQGMGIISNATQSFLVTNCTVYGKQWGIQTPRNIVSVIKNSNVSSTDHPLYLLNGADVYGSTFRIANRDKYTILDEPYGIYCGGYSENIKAVVNFYDCQIGAKEDGDKNSFNGVVSQAHYKGSQYAPSEINLYNTDIYTTQRAFTYNIGSDSMPIETKFNIYDDSQIYVYNKVDKNFEKISKETLNDEISSWKTILRQKEANGYCVYNRGIIYGNEIANINETTNTIKNLKITDSANVYDYRK